MIYPPISLPAAATTAGLLLIAGHVAALVAGPRLFGPLRAFPRSKPAGVALLVAAAAWALGLVWTMDLGEFSQYRTALKILVVAGTYLAIRYADDFLAARSLGMLLLLAAEPLLEAAFLKPGAGRLPLVLLAYAWAVAGLFCTGMPYLLRDAIAWLTRPGKRWAVACAAGALYGAALLIAPWIRYR